MTKTTTLSDLYNDIKNKTDKLINIISEKEVFGLSGKEELLANLEASQEKKEKKLPHWVCKKTDCDCDNAYDSWKDEKISNIPF